MTIKAWKKILLIIPVLLFIGSQVGTGQSAEPNDLPGERTISFPRDYSMGELSVRDWGSTKSGEWTVLGEGRGEVTVPAGKELRLKVSPDYSKDFSPLADLGPSDLQELHMEEVQVGDAGLAHLRGLTSLKLLSLDRKRAADKKHQLAGKPLGELKFKSLKGEQIDISQYKGKVVLIDFWATWCGPCVGELPNVKRTYDKYHDDGFEIIGISLDRDRERLEKFIEKNDMPWPQYFDGKGWKNEISTGFDIHSIPSTYLVDGEGIIRYVNLRGSALDNAVADMLGGAWRPGAPITDAGMVHLKGLTSLETLRLERTQVGDEGIAHLKDLTSLRTFYLGGTQVTDAGLEHVKNLAILERLCVHNTQVTDAGLVHLEDLTGLIYLCVHDTLVSDTGLSYLKGLTNLETLYLHNTEVNDAGLEDLKNLTKLQKLNLRGTRVSEAGLAELKEALPDCSITGPAVTTRRKAPTPRRAPRPRFDIYPEWSWDKPMPLYLRVLIGAIVIPIVTFLIALFLKIVTKWAVKFNIPYWTAYKIEIIAAAISFVIRIPLDGLGFPWVILASLVVDLFVHSIIYGQMIKHPDTNESIGFGKGLLIWFYLMLFWIAIAAVIGCALGFMFLVFRFLVRGLAG
jgi:peroxiredoxin